MSISSSSIAPTPSYITLPHQPLPYPSLLDFLEHRFPFVDRAIWQSRLESGKISDEHGEIVHLSTPYRINARLRYFREVVYEHPIPFQEHILFQNDAFLIADKPHFLPVTPSGSYVNECLLHRLKQRTQLPDLTPVHRLDRETAGLVLFTVQKKQRGAWFDLFRHGKIHKVYEAIASTPTHAQQHAWEIHSRIERGEPWIRFQNVEGEHNAHSRIRLLEKCGAWARFELEPITGKTHQLRLHMGLIGAHIVGDRLYPNFQPPSDPPNYEHPLQLLAKQLSFDDPITGQSYHFESQQQLQWKIE